LLVANIMPKSYYTIHHFLASLTTRPAHCRLIAHTPNTQNN